MIYCRKTYQSLKGLLQTDSQRRAEMCLNSLTTESYVDRSDIPNVSEAIGIMVTCIAFTAINIPKSILLIYETINIKWIQDHFTMCIVPPTLFYGKAVVDLLFIVNASVSIYLYFFFKNNCHTINIWLIKRGL